MRFCALAAALAVAPAAPAQLRVDVDGAAKLGEDGARAGAGAPPRVFGDPATQGVYAPGNRLVFTDVDDTLKCSGGGRAGSDTRLPHGVFYAGAAAFQLLLAQGRGPPPGPRVVPLSARPEELKALLALGSRGPEAQEFAAAAARLGIERGGLNTRDARYGELGPNLALSPEKSRLFFLYAQNKFRHWRAVSAAWQMPSVFVGDDGQGDLLAARWMLSDPRPLEVAFIHAAGPKQVLTGDEESVPGVARVRREGLVTGDVTVTTTVRQLEAEGRLVRFDTYADAALAACDRGLMTPMDYRQVLASIWESSLGRACRSLDSVCRPAYRQNVHKWRTTVRTDRFHVKSATPNWNCRSAVCLVALEFDRTLHYSMVPPCSSSKKTQRRVLLPLREHCAQFAPFFGVDVHLGEWRGQSHAPPCGEAARDGVDVVDT